MDRRPSQGQSLRSQSLMAWLPVFVAAFGAFILVYQWSDARPLWLDEEMIALNLRDRPFSGLAGRLWLDQSAPLGWLFLQKLVLLTLGPSELSLRGLPALFGVATIAGALYVGRRWLTTIGSTVLVLLCSCGQWMSFYALELKSYSADTFFGLMLPALAVSAAGAASSDERRRGIVIWATAAAIAHWFSLGALLVLPACCVVLAVAMRRQPETIRWLATGLAVTTASIAAHYLLSIRAAQGSTSLQQFWEFAMLPPGSSVAGALNWVSSQLEPFALKPAGTGLAAAFWISACVGFAAASSRMLGLAAGLVAASGFVLALVRMVPLYERLSLWFLPALYLGVALSADRAVWFVRERPLKPQWMNQAIALAGAIAVLLVCADVTERGVRDLRRGRPSVSNRATDDRSAIQWLMRERQPGDVLLTTRHALPAVWWYGNVSLAQSGGRHFPDGGRILVTEYHESRRVCHGRELEKALDGRSRIQVYLGFVDMPQGFDDLLLESLAAHGTITGLRHFAGDSRAAIVDPGVAGGSNLFWEDAGKEGVRLKGCILAGQARMW